MSRVYFWCSILAFTIAVEFAIRPDWTWAYFGLFVAYLNLEFSEYLAAEE